MAFLLNILPILSFVVVYVGSSLYFSWHGIQNAFYQVSPTVAILPALIVGWMLHKGSTQKRMNSFLEGVAHRDIITMCMIFLLAGAFSMVTKSIGSVDATVNLVISLIDVRFVALGIFIVASFISTAIGTSMGTIATLAPLVVGLAQQQAFGIELGMGVLISGAMFGDSLSPISDTTIAAVMSQEADFSKKLKVNAMVALIAAALTIPFLLPTSDSVVSVAAQSYNILLILPYVFLVAAALLGVNVFVVLIMALIVAGCVGHLTSGYSLLALSKDIDCGFENMYEITLLSLLVGGLSGLSSEGLKKLSSGIQEWIGRFGGIQAAQLCIGALVSFFDVLLANNTVAIIFTGQCARDIAKKYNIPAHYSAAWLDIFSCVFQGILPYGAQVLLASSIGGVSPLAVMFKVYYCYILGVVVVGYILWNKRLQS